ncbi:ImmA/IrrE family metallo-endopeptidase [Pseudomonas chlororaphis]
MARRNIALTTARMAAEVINSSRAMERVEQDGYTRVDPFRVADSVGLSVALRPMDKLLGAFIRDEQSGILLNSARSAGLIHMTCSHELGHYFMGHDTTVDETIEYGSKALEMEQEAEAFGYHLLVPRSLLMIVCRRKGWNIRTIQDPFNLYQLALRLGVSYAAAAWSLLRHEYVDYDAVQRLLKTTPASIKQSLFKSPLPDATKEVWVFDERDQSSVLEPRPDDHLIIRLKSHASAGYLWLADSPDQVKAEGFTLQPAPSAPVDPRTLTFGAETSMDYFLAGAPDSFTDPQVVALAEIRPWEGKQPGDASYVSKAHFEPIAEGLTRESKKALIDEVRNS